MRWNLRVRDLIATGLHRTDLLLRRSPVLKPGRWLRCCVPAASSDSLRGEFLSLSYGEKRLVLLARALVQEPDWLLLDELYNGLDARVPAAHRCGAGERAPPRPVLDRHRASRDGRAAQARIVDRARPRPHTAVKRLQRRISRACGHARMKRAARFAPPRGRRAAAAGRVLLRLSNVDVYVGYRAVLRDGQLAAAARRTLGDIRRERRRKIQLPETPVWRFGAGAGRANRARRVLLPGRPSSNGSGTSATSRLNCKAQYAVRCQLLELVASGRHSSIGLADADGERSEECARRGSSFSSCASVARAPAARTVLRATAPRPHCARAWRRMREFFSWMSRSPGWTPASVRDEAHARASDAAPTDAGCRRAPCGGPAGRHDAWIAFT